MASYDRSAGNVFNENSPVDNKAKQKQPGNFFVKYFRQERMWEKDKRIVDKF